MGRKKKLKINVRLVPPGGLRANPQHPYAQESPSQRREAMLRTIARGVAGLLQHDAAERRRPPLA